MMDSKIMRLSESLYLELCFICKKPQEDIDKIQTADYVGYSINICASHPFAGKVV